MGRFFGRNGILSHQSKTMVTSSGVLPMCTQPFKLSDKLHHEGKLVKVFVSKDSEEQQTTWETLQKEIIQPNKNSLFIWTTPTTRFISQHGEHIYPGHNFSSVTDETGKTVCTMSKRPDIKTVLGERKRVPDSRLNNQPMTTRLFSPRYTTVEEEIELWLKRACLVREYPLFVHIIPLVSELELDIASYKDHVDYLMQLKEAYTLFSFIHPYGDHYIPAGNCNSATEQSIFGLGPVSVHDLSCQEAAMNIVSRILKSRPDYLETAKALGLTKGIESPTIPEDFYRSAFTC